MSVYSIQKTVLNKTCQNAMESRIYSAFALGMAINLVSIYIGNPYLISLLTIPVAAVATFKWLNQPMPWIVLVSVITANPGNINASIALNLIFAFFFVILRMRSIKRLPPWLFPILFFSFFSIIGSSINWSSTGGFFTQFAAVVNYVIGPFFLIPLIYFRLQNENDADLLMNAFVFSLVVPSVFLILLARLFGTPMIYGSLQDFDSLVNISVYQLGNVNFQLTRTQVGIPLAVFICASFAVFVGSFTTKIRLIALILIGIAIFLLLVTGSVGSSLAAICGITVLLFIAMRYMSIKKYLVVLPILIGLMLAGWNQLPQSLKDYAASRYGQKVSGGIDISDRSSRWQLSLDYLIENPSGRGWDLYIASIGTYPHNDYLSYGIAFGIVCGLLYLFVPLKILLILVSVKIRLKHPSQVVIILAGVGAVTVLLINSFSDHLTANRWYFNVVWSIIWYCFFTAKANIGNPTNYRRKK